MIGVKLFGEKWTLLEERFRVEMGNKVKSVYHDILTELMDDETFVACCNVVIYSREFFPKPSDFVGVMAEVEWPKLQAACQSWVAVQKWDGEAVQPFVWVSLFEQLSERGRDAAFSLGGVPKIRELDPDLLRRRFTDAYVRSAVMGIQPPDLTPLGKPGTVLHLPSGKDG